MPASSKNRKSVAFRICTKSSCKAFFLQSIIVGLRFDGVAVGEMVAVGDVVTFNKFSKDEFENVVSASVFAL